MIEYIQVFEIANFESYSFLKLRSLICQPLVGFVSGLLLNGPVFLSFRDVLLWSNIIFFRTSNFERPNAIRLSKCQILN